MSRFGICNQLFSGPIDCDIDIYCQPELVPRIEKDHLNIINDGIARLILDTIRHLFVLKYFKVIIDRRLSDDEIGECFKLNADISEENEK